MICSRDSHVAHYNRYLQYETNLEALRRQRTKRLAVKSSTHAGRRRIFTIFERATQKFPGNVELWLSYAGYARNQRAHIKVSEVITRMLRLHPASPRLWIYAASYALEAGDMVEARSYLQRGLRFCETDSDLWLEYTRLELIFIARLLGRQKILGLDEPPPNAIGRKYQSEGVSDDLIALPSILSEGFEATSTSQDLDLVVAEKVDYESILSGAIPLAILTAAERRLENFEAFSLRFFDMAAEFDQLPCCRALLEHVLTKLRSGTASTLPTIMRHIQVPLIGVKADTADFPVSLGQALSRIDKALAEIHNGEQALELKQDLLRWTMSLLDEPSIDPDIRKVLEITTSKLSSNHMDVSGTKSRSGEDAVVPPAIVTKLQQPKGTVSGISISGDADEL